MQFGITNGVYRELPKAIGGGETEVADSIIITAERSLFFIYLFYLPIFLIVYFIYSFPITLEHYILFSLLLVVNQFYNFQSVISHSFFQFKELTIQMIVLSLSYPTLAWLGAKYYNFSGFIISQIVVFFFASIYLRKIAPKTSIHDYKINILARVIKTGIPVSIVGIVFSIVTSIDRWFIGYYLGGKVLGQYALAVFCVSSLSIITKMISPQFYPLMSYEFGRTGCIASIRNLVLKQFLVNIFVMMLVAVFFYLFIDILVVAFLPQYTPGLYAAKIIMPGVVCLACINPFSAMMNSTGKNRAYLIAQMFGLTSIVILILFASLNSPSLDSIAMATTLGYFLYMFFIVLTGLAILFKNESIKPQI